MNKLLEFLMTNFSYLYNELGCRFADSQVRGPDALLVFESNDLRIRFVGDRSQIFADFQSNRRGARNRWYSFGVVRQLLTGDVGGSEELDSNKAIYIRQHFSEIKNLFPKASHVGSWPDADLIMGTDVP
jgi:hypothetical protein